MGFMGPRTPLSCISDTGNREGRQERQAEALGDQPAEVGQARGAEVDVGAGAVRPEKPNSGGFPGFALPILRQRKRQIARLGHSRAVARCLVMEIAIARAAHLHVYLDELRDIGVPVERALEISPPSHVDRGDAVASRQHSAVLRVGRPLQPRHRADGPRLPGVAVRNAGFAERGAPACGPRHADRFRPDAGARSWRPGRQRAGAPGCSRRAIGFE